MILYESNTISPILTPKYIGAYIMSPPDSTLDEEPFVVESPLREKDDEAQVSEASSDEEDDNIVTVKKKFDEILRDLKNDKYDLTDPTKLDDFATEYGNFLGKKTTNDSDQQTLLHLLVDDAKDKVVDKYKPLVKFLIDHHPDLLHVKDSNGKTSLYMAISKKRDKLVRFICSTCPDIDAILKIPCYHAGNCIHVAIRQKVTPNFADSLIKHAGEKTLCAKDHQGNTPLHLAVAYERCTNAQLKIVKALVQQCDKAMDERTEAPKFFSPYRYHEDTRAEAEKAAEEEAKKAAKEKEKDAARGRKDEGGAAGGDGPGGKDIASTKIKVATQGKDAKAPNPVMAKGLGNTSSEAPSKKYEGPGESYSRAGGAGTGGYKSAGLGSGLGEPLRPGLNSRPLTSGLGSSNGKESNPKSPAVPKESRRKEREKKEVKVTEESANVIRSYLKLHCMRTRSHDKAVDFLYGRNQGM